MARAARGGRAPPEAAGDAALARRLQAQEDAAARAANGRAGRAGAPGAGAGGALPGRAKRSTGRYEPGALAVPAGPRHRPASPPPPKAKAPGKAKAKAKAKVKPGRGKRPAAEPKAAAAARRKTPAKGKEAPPARRRRAPAHARPLAERAVPEAGERAVGALRRSWKPVAILHFCRTFQKDLKLRPMNAEQLEGSLLRPDEHTQFLAETMHKLLREQVRGGARGRPRSPPRSPPHGPDRSD